MKPKSVESRIERLEVASGGDDPLLVCVVKFVPGRDSNGQEITQGELVGLEYGSGYVERKSGECEEALIGRGTALAEQSRGPRCGILLIARYAR